jgi:transposase
VDRGHHHAVGAGAPGITDTLNAAIARECSTTPDTVRHLHFTPTSASWLNLVEGWFAQLTNKRLKRGSFNSPAALTNAIDTWVSP